MDCDPFRYMGNDDDYATNRGRYGVDIGYQKGKRRKGRTFLLSYDRIFQNSGGIGFRPYFRSASQMRESA
jgi:hypothetical protein